MIAASRPAFRKLSVYSVALFFCSLSVFFLVRSSYVVDYFGLTPSGRDIASASAAVITTYVIIGLFTWDAFSEEEREEGLKEN